MITHCAGKGLRLANVSELFQPRSRGIVIKFDKPKMLENAFPSAFETNYPLHFSLLPSGDWQKNPNFIVFIFKNDSFCLTGKKRNLQCFPPLPTCADLQGMCAPARPHTRKRSPVTEIVVLHQHTLTGRQEDMFVFCFLTSPTTAEGGRYRN